jgi:hypothetical protein
MLWVLGVLVMGLCISTESYVATAWMGGILLGCGVFKLLNEDIENHPAGGPHDANGSSGDCIYLFWVLSMGLFDGASVRQLYLYR